jgi:hypothetical protein
MSYLNIRSWNVPIFGYNNINPTPSTTIHVIGEVFVSWVQLLPVIIILPYHIVISCVKFNAVVKKRCVLLPRVGLVHQSDLASNGGPLKLSAKRFVASLTLILFPFK